MVSITSEAIQKRKDALIACLSSNKCNIVQACKSVGISRPTYYDYYHSDEEFRNKVIEVEEAKIDYVESKLMQLIEKENTSAIIFFLKCKAKSRGYTEKQEVELDTNDYKLIEDKFRNLSDKQLEAINNIINAE